nr:3525_t:CDS:2 [Entrophospora candida]
MHKKSVLYFFTIALLASSSLSSPIETGENGKVVERRRYDEVKRYAGDDYDYDYDNDKKYDDYNKYDDKKDYDYDHDKKDYDYDHDKKYDDYDKYDDKKDYNKRGYKSEVKRGDDDYDYDNDKKYDDYNKYDDKKDYDYDYDHKYDDKKDYDYKYDDHKYDDKKDYDYDYDKKYDDKKDYNKRSYKYKVKRGDDDYDYDNDKKYDDYNKYDDKKDYDYDYDKKYDYNKYDDKKDYDYKYDDHKYDDKKDYKYDNYNPIFWRILDLRLPLTGFGLSYGRVHEVSNSDQIEIISKPYDNLKDCMTIDQILEIGNNWAVNGIHSTLDLKKGNDSLIDLLRKHKPHSGNDNDIWLDAKKLAESHADDPVIKWIFQVIVFNEVCVKNVQLGIPPGGERSVDIHFIRPFMDLGELISSASGARKRRFGIKNVGQHSDFIFAAHELRDASVERGREFGIAENSGPEALLKGTLDANLNKALKEIPIVGICIVEFTIKMHVIFYLGDGIWAADEIFIKARNNSERQIYFCICAEICKGE